MRTSAHEFLKKHNSAHGIERLRQGGASDLHNMRWLSSVTHFPAPPPPLSAKPINYFFLLVECPSSLLSSYEIFFFEIFCHFLDLLW